MKTKQTTKTTPKPTLTNEENAVIRHLVDSYYGIQKARIETSNRIDMLQRDYGLSEDRTKELHAKVDDQLILAEANIKRELSGKATQVQIYEWLDHVRGIGPIISAGLISGIQSPSRFETVSKLWRFCGMAVINGNSERKIRGEKIHYSPFMKTLCWKIGESFVKFKGYYRERYDAFKAEYRVMYPVEIDTGLKSKKGTPLKKYSDGHIHAMAKRKTVKLFLAHLFEVWREMEGNPYRNPYCERLGHLREPAPRGAKI